MIPSANADTDRPCLAARFVDGPHVAARDKADARLAEWLADLKPEHTTAIGRLGIAHKLDVTLPASELARFCRHLPCKVNIIEYNPIAFANFINAGEDKVEAFADYLRSQGINTNLRRSRGKDIDAACGQLAIKENEKVS